jgi:hypothetical protein
MEVTTEKEEWKQVVTSAHGVEGEENTVASNLCIADRN